MFMTNSSEILEERLKFDAQKKPFPRGEAMAALGQTLWARATSGAACAAGLGNP